MASDVTRARRRVPAALVVVAVLTFAANAGAQPTAAEKAAARELMEQGDSRRDKGDLQGALKAFESADGIMHVPTTGLEVARVQADLGKLVEARETAARVLKLPARTNEPAPFVAARKAADQLASELAVRIPTLTIAVTNVEPGQSAQVTLDGETVPPGALDAPRKVNPGKHLVVVRAGAVEKREDVQVVEREQRAVTFDMKPKVVAAPKPKPPPTEDTPDTTPRALMIGGFALAAVGVGVGSVTGLMSISKVNDIKKDCSGDTCPADRQGDIDSARSLGTISSIAFIAAGVGVGVGVVGYFMSKSPPSSEPAVGQSASAGRSRVRVRVAPEIGPTWAGLHGTF